jgi:hypothetical protein
MLPIFATFVHLSLAATRLFRTFTPFTTGRSPQKHRLEHVNSQFPSGSAKPTHSNRTLRAKNLRFRPHISPANHVRQHSIYNPAIRAADRNLPTLRYPEVTPLTRSSHLLYARN